MYQLVSAIAKSITERGRWIDVDLSNVSIKSIYENYVETKVVLTNSFIDHPVCLDMRDIREANYLNEASLPQWLLAIGSASLPTTDVIPKIETRYIGYADAVHAGYKLKPVHPTASPDADVADSEKTSLFVSKPNLDFALWKKHVLTTINGFFHFNDSNAEGAWIMDGMRTARHSNLSFAGIISFKGVSDIKQIRITPSMIYKQDPNQSYGSVMHINVGQDISNKTIALVIGGYLHIHDPLVFRRVGDRTIAVSFTNLPLIDRYHESLPYIDYSALPIQRTGRNPTQIGLNDFTRDENMIAYMTMSQSFIVIIDNPDVFIDKQYVLSVPVPGYLVSYVPPLYPLVTGLGKVSEYWYTYEDQQYSLKVNGSFTHNRLYRTVDLMTETSVGDQRDPYFPVKVSDAFFLKIGTNS